MSGSNNLKKIIKNSKITHIFKLRKRSIEINNLNDFIKNKTFNKLKYQGKAGGIVYTFTHNDKKYAIKFFINQLNICKESGITKKVSEYMFDTKIPELYVKCHHIFKITTNYRTYYLIIMDYIDYEVWDILDKKNVKKIKSLILQILVGIWFLNHVVKINHGDICAYRGKKGLALHNVMLNIVKQKNLKFTIDDEIIKFPNRNIKISIIDFGQSCNINMTKTFITFQDISHTMGNIVTSNKRRIYAVNHFFRKKPFKNFKFRSELIYMVYCLLKYYKFKNVDDKLYKYCTNLLEKCKKKNARTFDKELIKDLNKNFEKFMKSFSNNWPTKKKLY